MQITITMKIIIIPFKTIRIIGELKTANNNYIKTNFGCNYDQKLFLQ